MRVGEVGEVASVSEELAGPVTTRLRAALGNPRPIDGVRPKLAQLAVAPALTPSGKARGGTGSDSRWDAPKKASVLELDESAGLTAPSF